VVTTGSQAEPRAQLSLAAREASPKLRINPSDLVLYSAKMIPGGRHRGLKGGGWLGGWLAERLRHDTIAHLGAGGPSGRA
jgi:hypothetical protein